MGVNKSMIGAMYADDELDRLIHDPGVERLQLRLLKAMAADGSDPLRRDLARDLLAGVTLAEASRSSVYASIFEEGAREFMQEWEARSDQEREEWLAGAEEGLRPFLQELDDDVQEPAR